MYYVLFFLVFCIIICEMQRVIKIAKLRNEFIQEKNIEVSGGVIRSLFAEFVKRLFDVFFSFIVCLTILPFLYLVLGVVIKLTSSGPIIFRQKRVGFLGQMFDCYKFRSMYLDAGEKIAIKGDERVTPIGRFLRKTHIDEFPQFFNVLIGDMSIVGPRPTICSVVNELQKHPHYLYRVLLLPGITGVSQIHGRQEDQMEMFKFDLEYIHSQSFLGDLKIIFKTLKFKDESY